MTKDQGRIPWAGTSSAPSLKGVKLVRTFGDGSARRAALQEAAMDLYPGQLVLLMGPSGSGKSTLLAVLSGLLEPDSGQVLADDDGVLRDVWQMTAKERETYRRKHTGFIFQGYNLFPALTARQQLEIVLKWGEGAGPGDAKRRADEMLDRLGLAKNKHKKPAQLSGGEKQRVAIGRALVKNPSFLFADEPTSALDWENGQQVIELLHGVARQRGSTVLVVTHDPRLVNYADRVIEMADGKLTADAANVSGTHHLAHNP